MDEENKQNTPIPAPVLNQPIQENTNSKILNNFKKVGLKLILIVILLVVFILLIIFSLSYFKPTDTKLTKNYDFNFKSGVLTKLLKENYNYKIEGSFYYHDCMISPNGFHTACLKYILNNNTDSRDILVVDGKEKEDNSTSSEITELQFTPDNKLAYIRQASPSSEMIAVINGKEEKPYPFVGRITFSTDGNHYSYCIGEEKYKIGDSPFIGYSYKKTAILVDGKPIKYFNYDATLDDGQDVDNCQPVFNPTTNQVAYSMIDSKKNILEVNGMELYSSTNSSISKPLFSKDGSKLIFTLSDKNGEINSRLVDLSGNLINSFNGNPYGGFKFDNTGDNILWIKSSSLGAQKLFLNNRIILEPNDSIWNAAISNDGSKIIFTYLTLAASGKVMIGDDSTSPTAHVVYNGSEIDNYKTFFTRVSYPVFSKDDKYMAYLSATLGESYHYNPNLSKLIISDGQKICKIPFKGVPLKYNLINSSTAELGAPTFAPIKDYLGFGYMLDNQIVWKVGKINMEKCSLDEEIPKN